jgi:hypothetical protein
MPRVKRPPPKKLQQLPGASVAWYVIGRVLIAPDGTGQEIGYFVFLDGIQDPLFAGPAPASEATAYFTVRSDPFSIHNVQNGDLTVTLLSQGNFKLYYNAHPHADFSDPNTFSNGQLIATFRRVKATLISVGPMTIDVFWASLEASAKFVHEGSTYDLKTVVPNGITEIGAASSRAMPAITGYPAVLPFVGASLAVGKT